MGPVKASRLFPAAAATAAAAVVLTRWPFRAQYLFSWDSANYALAMQRIDISAHRPHPPGYLGYVLTARGMDALVDDANAALVLWNIVAAALVAVIVLRIAFDIAAHQRRPGTFVSAAGSIVVTSPLLWFYSDVAEIYPSELLVTLVIAFCAWRTLRGDRRALFELALAIPVAASFKLTAAVFTLPLAAWAWWRASPHERVRAGVLLAAASIGVAVFFLASAPGLVEIIWNQFTTSTSASRVVAAPEPDFLDRLSRNARDTLTAAVAALGIGNIVALIVWGVRDRKLPVGIDRTTALLWSAPFILFCVLVHIGKPGYILPVLPLATLILAGFYARLRRAVAVTLVVVQAAANIAQFVVFAPLPDSLTGGRRPYREKTRVQRIASDVQLLAFPTASVIRETDESVDQVLATVRRVCPTMNPIVIAALDPVDARRLMWYLPAAPIVHIENRSVVAIARNGVFEAVRPVTEWIAACPVLWLSAADKPREFDIPEYAAPEAGVGFIMDARRVRVMPSAILFER